MSTLHRRMGCLALVLAIGGCGQASGTGGPLTAAAPSATASPTSDEPSGSPSPIVRPLRNPDIDPGVPEVLEPGTYVLDRFPVDLAFDIPDGSPPGWHAGTASEDFAILMWYTPPEITYVVAFWPVDDVHVDPCDAAAGELEPPVGPSVDALVTALSNLPGFQATDPVDVTVGAFRGKEIVLTALDSGADCPAAIAFSSGDDITDVSAGESLRLQILDVDGVRIVMSPARWVNTREPTERNPAAEAELQQILDSIRIEPLP